MDGLLFVGEAPLPGPIEGASGLRERFVAAGRRDPQGRSLRELDLDGQLFRHACSPMIHSSAFASLPATVQDTVHAAVDAALRGEPVGRSTRSEASRLATLEILRATLGQAPPSSRAPQALSREP
ncbi:MAG: hypothetical protein FJW23_08715 [Acidimicrobiia bacterium]|nr:hypothetical protein [Acidimicrobiia bacterium]